ncbi:sensor domain-containing diguanylate cyclase [Thalassotalea sp. PLHSN55]|uniref:sensor domain-containing diguanylate cyclase n=1 Tax=Thalassotalea sp. PLHSN55 TaxID=3435888 RepID=UPI003F848208
MKTPALPENEASRLATLQMLKILDSSFEERFDRITRLARKLFDAEIALVSLVDQNRQWFKSCQGLDVRETPRDISFCGHAILDQDILYIPDASKDERFFDNPIVVDEPYIRFYAGRPITSPKGDNIGTLCIIDSQPKELEQEDFHTLNDLAKLIEGEIFSTMEATTDELTQLANRRGFMQLAEHQMRFCKRYQIGLTLIYFDLDHFKEINDKLGHSAGDDALITFAENLRASFRDSDIISRMGGDEFVVMLSDTGLDEAELIVKRLKKNLYLYENTEASLEFSHGAVRFDPDTQLNLQELIDAADKLMFLNKKK